MSLSALMAQDETSSNIRLSVFQWLGDQTQNQSIGISVHYHQTNWPPSCGVWFCIDIIVLLVQCTLKLKYMFRLRVNPLLALCARQCS